mgnify:CR=1 FL=1
MPLVQFAYKRDEDQAFPIDLKLKKTLKIKLPARARKANWKLKVVNATHYSYDGFETAKWFEINLPDLMVGNHVFFSLNSQVGTQEPRRNLRFYMNRYQNDQNENEQLSNGISLMKSCVSNPDLDFGYHVLDSDELTLEVQATDDDATHSLSSLHSFTIILEYNE